MTINEILELGKMGYTKEEILAMQGIGSEPEPQSEPEQQPEPQPEPEPQPQPQPINESLSTGINALLEDMHQTLKGMQAANIKNSRMPEVEAKKPEDILAEVIYPSFKKEG